MTNYVIDSSLTKIGDYAFYSQPLVKVKFNNKNAIDLGKYAFAECDRLVSINQIIPYVDSIGEGCFLNCSNLYEKITINASNQQSTLMLNKMCFANSGILELNINTSSNTQVVFQENVFKNCTNLNKLDLSRCAKMPLILNVNVFEGTLFSEDKGIIYVPISLQQTYLQNSFWSTYANLIKAV